MLFIQYAQNVLVFHKKTSSLLMVFKDKSLPLLNTKSKLIPAARLSPGTQLRMMLKLAFDLNPMFMTALQCDGNKTLAELKLTTLDLSNMGKTRPKNHKKQIINKGETILAIFLRKILSIFD